MGTVVVMGEQQRWDDLGELMRVKRVFLGLTQAEAAQRAGISPTTWRQMELGQGGSRRDLTMSAVEKVLHWIPGSAQLILDGKADEPGLRINRQTGEWERAIGHEGERATAEAARRALERAERSQTVRLPAALSGVDFESMTEEEARQVRGYIDGMRERRAGGQ